MNTKPSKPSKSSFGRRLGLIALAAGIAWFSTSGASAQLTSEVSSALASLNHTLAANKQVTLSSTSVTITSAQLETLMLSLSGSDVTNNTPANIATNITSILGVINTAEGNSDIGSGSTIASLATDTTQLDLLSSANNALKNSSYYSANFGKVVGAILAYGNYSNYLSASPPLTETAIDTAETAIVTQAITDNKTDLTDIVAQALLNSDPSGTAQGNLVATEVTTTSLGNATTTGTALGAQVLLTDSNAIGTNAGPFLQALTIKEATTGAAVDASFIEGYTAGLSPSALETTASNIVANSTALLTSAMRLNVFTALLTSGSANGETVSTVVSDVTAGLVSGYSYMPASVGTTPLTEYSNGNDKLKATFVNTLITNYPSYETTIASAGATQLNTVGDLLPFAATVAGNSAITGSNNIASVAAAIANDFVLTGTASGSLDTTDLNYKVDVAQAFIDTHSTDAGLIASAVAQQVLGGTDQTPADQINFATNFIGTLDSLSVASANGVKTVITDTLRGEMAAALAVDYDGFAGAVAQIALAAAQTDTPGSGNTAATPVNISTIVQPVLNAFLPGGAAGANASAATVEATAALVSQSFGGLSYIVGGVTIYFKPAVVGAALITGAGTNAGLIGDIALGDATDATIDTVYGAGTSGTDGFITALSTQFKTKPGDLVDIADPLALNSAFTPQEIAGDVAAANPADAPLLASDIVTEYPSITGTQASAVATAAAGVAGATAAEIEMTGSDVVVDVPSSLNYVAKSLSGVMVTDFGGGTAATLSTDQATLAKDLALTPAGAANLVQVAYEVALNGQTDSAIAAIGLKVMLLTPGLNSTSATSFAETFIGDLNSGAPTNNTGFGFNDVASITNSFVTGLPTSTYPGAGTAVTTGLVEQEVTSAALAEPVALAFATDLPATSATTVAIAATTEDGTDGYAEAGSIANAIISLTKVGVAKAPTIALAVLAGIPNTALDTAQAINIAEDATDLHGETSAEIVTTATDVVNYINTNATQSGQAAAALPAIAQNLSAQLVTDFGNVTATITDQEALAGGLAATPIGRTGTNAVVIAYNVALSGTSDANISGIADAALKAVPTDYTSTGAGLAATFADDLIADLTAAHPGSFSSFGYTDMAKIGAAFASGISSTVVGSGTAVATGLVNQELAADGGSVSNAASIGGAFASAFTSSSLPSIGISISNQAFNSTFASPLNPEQSGTIGAAIAANLPATSALASGNAATSGSIAVLAAYAGTPTLNQYNLNDSLQDVAGVFASYTLQSGSAVPTGDYLSIETDLALQTGSNSVRATNLAIPSIVAAFAPSYGTTQASLTALLTRLLSNANGDLNDYVNTPDIFGVLVAYDSGLAGDSSLQSALITAIEGDVAADLTAYYENQFTGPFANDGTSLTKLKASLGVLLEDAAAAAGGGAYGNINANETPIVNM